MSSSGRGLTTGVVQKLPAPSTDLEGTLSGEPVVYVAAGARKIRPILGTSRFFVKYFIMKSSVDPGEQLDHYRIEDVVARTITASIFRATDLNTNRPVAIEVPHPEMEGDPGFV